METLTVIVISFVTFNIGLVLAAMWYVRKVKMDQITRQKRVLALAKQNHDLHEENKLLEKVVASKDSLIEKYRELVNKFF